MDEEMKTLNEHIKNNQYAKAYLLYGEEAYLKRVYKNRLKDGIVGDDSMNLSYYEGKDISIPEITDLSQTMPFFAERRLILLENSGMFKSSSEAMAELVKNAPETTYFVFVEQEVDKRNRLYKRLNEMGYICELKSQTEESLSTWAARLFQEGHKKITRDTMVYLLGKTGHDMDNIANEVAKLVAYTGEREAVTVDDIDGICVVEVVDRVFDMIHAISMKEQDKVIRLYGDLIARKEPPMKILALLGKQFATLLAVKEMAESGRSSQVIAERLGIRPYFMSRYLNQAKFFSPQQLRQAVEDCVETEQAVKSGTTEDEVPVELLILKFSM